MKKNFTNILNPELSEEEDAYLVEKFRKDERLFIESFLHIKTKVGNIVPFKFKPSQVFVYEKIQELRRLGRPVRLVILKGRQVGISTLIEAMLFCRTRLYKNSMSMIVAHENKTAEQIFKMTGLFHDRLPDELKAEIRHNTREMIRFETKREKERAFNPGLMSEIQIATAKNVDTGAGVTPMGLHLTEFARWATPRETLLSLMQGVPETENTIVAVESTAKGADGYFYEMWRGAVTGKNGWTPIFLPFWMENEYELDILPNEEESFLFENLLDDEKDLMRRFPEINTRKLKWRRWMIENKCQGSVNNFNQEYAPDAESCFIAQGTTLFDINAIMFYLKNYSKNGTTGKIGVNKRGGLEFIAGPGPLTIWSPPRRGEDYVIGADSSLGARMAQQRKSMNEDEAWATGDGDFSAAIVLSSHREQVAEYRNNLIDPVDFAEVLALLGRWYNTALIYPEVGNGGGWSLQYRLKEIYYRIGRWEKWDLKNQKLTEYIGFEPTYKANIVMFGDAMRELRRGADMLLDEEKGKWDKSSPKLKLYSKKLLGEMTTFTMRKDGTAAARSGKHDDLVRAFCLAVMGLRQIPTPKEIQGDDIRAGVGGYNSSLPTSWEKDAWNNNFPNSSIGMDNEYPSWMFL